MTTDEIGQVIYEVLEKYGSGKTCNISAKWIDAPAKAEFTDGSMDFTASLQLTLSVEGEVALQASFQNLYGKLALHSADGQIFGEIDEKTSIGTIDPKSFKTTLGMNATAFQSELGEMVYEGIITGNSYLTTGI